ncbi:hypothetical protein [Streptomyces spiramenti]|uniref:Uncharacterized protein n=1 Tax=Streptomyces spiramenti TaxID=2720606 RepID=A0ABX1ALW4_9ACTN|nr:hypothetical protein [Streptomyces spiramenti]NJP65462.1 hypothetical protein [Streptomyces spiramenti]
MPMAFHVQPVETKDGRTVFRVSLDQHGVAAATHLVAEPTTGPELPDGFGFGAERGGLRAVHGVAERAAREEATTARDHRADESHPPVARRRPAAAPRRAGATVRLGPGATRHARAAGAPARLRLVADPAESVTETPRRARDASYGHLLSCQERPSVTRYEGAPPPCS